MTVQPETIFGRSQGITSIVITLNQEWNSTCRTKGHSQYHSNTLTLSGGGILPWMCCWKAAVDDNWNVDGGLDLSEPWTGFNMEWNWLKFLQTDTRGAGGGWRKFKQRQGLIIDGQKFGQECQKAAQRREKQHWAVERLKLDSARKLRGIYFIDPNDREFRKHIKNARKKLESPVESAMPCKVQNLRHGETWGKNKSNTRRWRCGCIVEAHESTRKRSEETQPKDHEYRIGGKGFNSLSHYNLVHCTKQWKSQMQKPLLKNGEKILKNCLHGKWRKSGAKKKVIQEAQKEGRTEHFAALMDICKLKKSELEPKFQKYWGRVVLRGDTVKGASGSYGVFMEQGLSASQMTAAKVMDAIARLPSCAGRAADAESVFSQVKMEDASALVQLPKSECPDTWIRLPRPNWPKSWSNIEEPVVPLERILFGHPFAGLLWERQFEKVLLENGRENVPNWECLFVHRKQGLLLSTRWTGRACNVPWSCVLEMHSTRV